MPAALAIALLLPAATDSGSLSGTGDTPGRTQNQTAFDPILRKCTRDLDGMIQRRAIRVPTTCSKTNHFVDKSTQCSLVYDFFRLFEDDLNRKLENRHIRVYAVILPVSHDDLIPALLEGRGDIVADNRDKTHRS